MGGDRYCGFCGKHETEVARLIAGPIANICNECVELQHGMLNEDPSRKRSLHEVLSRARQRRIAELEAELRERELEQRISSLEEENRRVRDEIWTETQRRERFEED